MINQSDGGKEYEVFVPVYFDGEKLGTLAIRKSLIATEAVTRQVSTIGLVALLIVYASLLYILISTYKKNKKLTQLAYYDTLTGLPNNLKLIVNTIILIEC